MKEKDRNHRDDYSGTCSDTDPDERRKDHRRAAECEGYAYIAMVGWMDRRERTRRNGDPACF